jgi:hypothetical membrane protein
MKKFIKIKIFTDRYPLIGPIMWVLSIQYFLVQIIVGERWAIPYSITQNTISDLGNTNCGQYSGRYICSPLHSLMNASFIMLGTFMAVGALFIYQEFRETKLALLGFSFMLLAGLGTLMVGLFPENTTLHLHTIGAFFPFLLGNLGILILGIALDLPRILHTYTIITAVVALTGLVFFLTNHYLGLGIGGMERITLYPQTLWLIFFGIYMSKNHIKKIEPLLMRKGSI